MQARELKKTVFPIERRPVARGIKRAADVCLSAGALVLLSPVFLLAAIGIKLSSPGAVLYYAQRMGKEGVPFRAYKFRTMHEGADRAGAITAVGDARVFPLGRLLRLTKIDELPQLLNILRGEMSIVGPRPEDVQIVKAHYTERELLTLRVLPGLACPGSIFYYTHGERYLEGEDADTAYVEKLLHVKLSLDLYYLRHWTIAYDLRIIARTIAAIWQTSVRHKQMRVPMEYRILREKTRCRKKR